MKVHRRPLIFPPLLLLFLLTVLSSAEADQEILIDDFRSGMRPEWEPKIFNGETYYSSTSVDGIPCVRGTSNGTASGMFFKKKFDPKEYPIVNWKWKVNNIINKGDARSKSGDDYAARIYIAFPSFFFLKTKVLNYIWANKLPVGTLISNSYSANFAMIAVESGRSNLGIWREYRMNIYEDYEKAFGHKPPNVGIVAFMTDTDDTGESASACYGSIRFLAKE